MRFHKSFQLIASFLIIMAMLVMPFSSLQKANAQVASQTSGTQSKSISNYINQLSPLISKLPGCTSALGSGVKNIFSGVKNLFKSKAVKKAEDAATKKLEEEAKNEAAGVDAIAVDTKTANPILNKVYSNSQEILNESQQIKTATTSDNKNLTCLNSIGKAVVKMLVDQMTVGIVNWIQTGDFGDPLFLTDSSKFFKDYAKNEILGFGQEISDVTKYPFAKNFMLGVANSFNNKFQDNAQYSLDKVLAQQSLQIGVPTISPKDFFGDFSQGGWDAWDALTQNPANNPLGFQLIASNEMQKRLIGTDKSAAELINDQINSSGGFLDVKVCDDPRGVTKEEDLAARSGSANTNMYSVGNIKNDSGYQGTARICKSWKTVTPGYAVADQLTKSMSNSQNALLSADTLNDAISAILDAALAKMSRELTDSATGLANMSTDVGPSYDTNGYEDSGLATEQTDQIDQDFSSYQRDSSPWLQSHPDFDIRKDVNQALIDEQRIYIEKIKKQSEFLPQLITWIDTLDWCIPGPHPGWQDDAQAELDKIIDNLNIDIGKVKDMKQDVWYKLGNTLTLGGLGMITDVVNEYSFDCGEQAADNAGDIIATTLDAMTGIGIKKKNNTILCTAGGFESLSSLIMDQYSKKIDKYYNYTTLPTVAKEAADKFYEIPGYKKMLKDNDGVIAFQTSVIKKLQTIKDAVDKLNCQLDVTSICTQHISQDEYEGKLTQWKNAFARLSSSLVSGNDIAQVDDFTNQVIAETEYVKDDLLNGPAGCWAELKDNPMLPLAIGEQIRPDYVGGPYYDDSRFDWGVDQIHKGPKAFLNDVVFGSYYGNKTTPYVEAPDHSTYHGYLDTIDLHPTDTGPWLNFNDTGFGGSPSLWEKALKIY